MYLSIYLHASIYPSIHPYIHLFPFIYPSIYPFIQSIHLYIYLSSRAWKQFGQWYDGYWHTSPQYTIFFFFFFFLGGNVLYIYIDTFFSPRYRWTVQMMLAGRYLMSWLICPIPFSEGLFCYITKLNPESRFNLTNIHV